MGPLRKRVVWTARLIMILAVALLVTGCGSVSGTGGNSNGADGYTVSGIVVDEDDNGIEDVVLSFSGTSSITQTKSDGAWTATGLQGTVTITPAHVGYTFEPTTHEVTRAKKNIRFVGKKWAAQLLQGGTSAGNYRTIQAAIDAAQAGDVVKVFPGTYDENLVIDKPMTLRGTDPDDQAVVDATIINGADASKPTIESGAYKVVVEGLTVIG